MNALLNGPFGRVPLSSTPFTIGRLPDNHLVISDPKTSSRHAEIRQDAGTYTLTDLGSMNGTFVNEQQLMRNEPHKLNSGDVIRIGDTRFTYEVSNSTQIEPTVFAGQVNDPAYAPTISVPPVSPTPVLAEDATGQGASSGTPSVPATPQPSSSASSNTAYGMGMSGTAREENQQEYQRQPYVPYMPSGQPGVSPQPPYKGQPTYPPSSQPLPQQPMYGQPGSQNYSQQPMYGQPIYGQGYPPQAPYGPQGYPMPPQYGTVPVPVAGTQPRRSRRIALIAAIVGGLVVLAVILSVVYFAVRSTPTKTLTTFCSDIQSGNYQGAYDQFSARVRESGTETSFASALKTALVARKGLKGCAVGDVTDDGGAVNGVMTWVFNDSGPSVVFKTTLLDENGAWKIDNLTQ